MASLADFENDLVSSLDVEPPADLISEGDLERRHVLRCVWNLVRHSTGLHVYAHPWKQRQTCEPDCAHGLGILESPDGLHGCRKCWKKSKSTAAVKLYGTHCFDVVVAGEDETLALEVKLLRNSSRGNTKANGSFQRFVGQCLLAGLVHKRVVGFCVAEEGALDWTAKRDMQAFGERGIKLIIRKMQTKTTG